MLNQCSILVAIQKIVLKFFFKSQSHVLLFYVQYFGIIIDMDFVFDCSNKASFIENALLVFSGLSLRCVVSQEYKIIRLVNHKFSI